MNKLQKKNLLIERGEPLIIRQAPNNKHNEVTVAIIEYAVPSQILTRVLSGQMLKRVQKIATSCPSAGIKFNFNADSPTFTFTCKGKTERRGNDINDQKLADRIAVTKCRARAYTIAKNIATVIAEELRENAHQAEDIAQFLSIQAEREHSYIHKI